MTPGQNEKPVSDYLSMTPGQTEKSKDYLPMAPGQSEMSDYLSMTPGHRSATPSPTRFSERLSMLFEEIFGLLLSYYCKFLRNKLGAYLRIY